MQMFATCHDAVADKFVAVPAHVAAADRRYGEAVFSSESLALAGSEAAFLNDLATMGEAGFAGVTPSGLAFEVAE
jgi:hypothetical protein